MPAYRPSTVGPAPRPTPGTLSTKSPALFALLLLALLALSPPSARAQGPGTWVPVPCNPDGSTPVTNPTYDNEGFLGMWWQSQSPVTGSASTTYPDGSDGAYSPAAGPLSPSGPAVGAAASNQDSAGRQVGGTVTAQAGGTVSAYYTWQYQGPPGQGGTPPDHMDMLVKTLVQGGTWGTTQAPGLSASATATDGFGDTLAPSGGSQVAYHLKRVSGGYGSPAAVDLYGQVEVDLSNFAPVYDASVPVYYGKCDIGGYAQVVGGVKPDSRDVTISSGIETSYYKFTGPTIYSNRYQHQRNDDGSISVDSVLQWQEASPNNLAGWVVNDFPFTANALNFNSPVYSWTATGQGNIFYPSRQTPTFSLLVPGNGSFPAQSTLTVNVTDGDGAVGTNTYNVTWHLPAENWKAASPGAPYTTVIPSSGPLDTCIANDSVSGQWSYTEDSQGSSISLGDMFSAASGLVDPPYAAFIAAAGIVFSKTQPEESPVHTVVFNDAWGSPYSTFEPQPQDNSLDTMSRYKMAPLLALTYQHQEYNGDQYDVHGYAGPTSEGFEQVIKAQGCGNFTPIH